MYKRQLTTLDGSKIFEAYIKNFEELEFTETCYFDANGKKNNYIFYFFNSYTLWLIFLNHLISSTNNKKQWYNFNIQFVFDEIKNEPFILDKNTNCVVLSTPLCINLYRLNVFSKQKTSYLRLEFYFVAAIFMFLLEIATK